MAFVDSHGIHPIVGARWPFESAIDACRTAAGQHSHLGKIVATAG